MKIKLNINDRAATSIKNGTKRVEIRVLKENLEYDYSKLKENDIIEFNSSNMGIFYVKVKEVNHYNSLDELFTMEGTRYTAASINDKNETINSLNEYEEAIRKNGVFAIHIEYLYSENTVWDELIEKAKNVRNPRDVSGMISAGGVGAAILTSNHNIYTGVCIDTACTLGMCAERNAIANMITNGESEIIKLVCIDSKDEVGSPCGACREYLMQLHKNSKNIEILKNNITKETVRLEELIPNWWGYDRV